MIKKEEQHSCKKNGYEDAKIRYEQINVELWSWILEQTWYATESEVKDGVADHEREIISTHTLLISYCPFCGINLTKK